MPYDFHFHSYYSDGRHSPAELADMCRTQGLEAAALTDHDCIDGLEEFRRASGGAFQVYEGVELTSGFKEREIHILAYGADWGASSMDKLLNYNQSLRHTRAEALCQSLNPWGIDLQALKDRFPQTSCPSRLHLAMMLEEKGAVKDVSEAFRLCLGDSQLKDFNWPGMSEVCAAVQDAGGRLSLAHPGRYGFENPVLRRLFREFRELGGEAVEVSHGGCSQRTLKRITQLARESRLKASAGSDFHYHGGRHQLGGFPAPPQSIEKLFSEMERSIPVSGGEECG